MFGLNDNEDAKKEETSADAALAAPHAGDSPDLGATAVDGGSGPILPISPVVTPTEPTAAPPALPDFPIPSASAIEAVPNQPATQNPSAPPLADATMPEEAGPGGLSLENAYSITDEKSASDKKDKQKGEPKDSPALPSMMGGGAADDELIKLKTQALQNLAPLVDKLDQTPEEKFKTTMMLIQASDNADLVPDAYEAANKIDDEKARAQALLDVVNEINYFTKSDKSEDEK